MENIKNECIERLKILGLDSKIINDFEKEGKIYISVIDKAILEATQYNYVLNLIKSFEKDWDVKIYHIISVEEKMKDTIHILYVSKDESTWEAEKEDLKNGYAQAHTLKTVRTYMQNNIGISLADGKIIKVVC